MKTIKVRDDVCINTNHLLSVQIHEESKNIEYYDMKELIVTYQLRFYLSDKLYYDTAPINGKNRVNRLLEEINNFLTSSKSDGTYNCPGIIKEAISMSYKKQIIEEDLEDSNIL